MLYCDFYRRIKALNPRFKVYGDDSSPDRPWGLYLADKYGTKPPQHICGISTTGGMVYELTERRWDGYILRQGWRRIMKILIEQKYVDRNQAEKVFSTSFRSGRHRKLVIEKDPLTRAWEEARERGFNRTGDSQYVDLDDVIDLHRWRVKLREDNKNYWA